jgi:hypothetical protein
MTDKPLQTQPWRDPIVAEVRQAREALFAAAGYDIHEFCRLLRERQETSGHVLVRRALQPDSGSAGEAV